MNRRLLQFRKATPPTESEFLDIAKLLCDALIAESEFPIVSERPSVEPGRWVTTIVHGERNLRPIGRLGVHGTVTFLVGDAEPEISSVLLLFLDGKRITQGELSVLESEYDLNSRRWLPFEWKRDLYGEWECDDYPPILPTQ